MWLGQIIGTRIGQNMARQKQSFKFSVTFTTRHWSVSGIKLSRWVCWDLMKAARRRRLKLDKLTLSSFWPLALREEAPSCQSQWICQKPTSGRSHIFLQQQSRKYLKSASRTSPQLGVIRQRNVCIDKIVVKVSFKSYVGDTKIKRIPFKNNFHFLVT